LGSKLQAARRKKDIALLGMSRRTHVTFHHWCAAEKGTGILKKEGAIYDFL
jgi:hypothetical protein